MRASTGWAFSAPTEHGWNQLSTAFLLTDPENPNPSKSSRIDGINPIPGHRNIEEIPDSIRIYMRNWVWILRAVRNWVSYNPKDPCMEHLPIQVP